MNNAHPHRFSQLMLILAAGFAIYGHGLCGHD
ncbi:Uncharacterised protein [Serratia fonticola]|nr:Uncharacterised protein [Serratia fonticola]CAI1072173.1 Uncharacterised protein [Serratia fonticola]CAI1999164.1 Uncharacterised protein [Serratia fonticola]